MNNFKRELDLDTSSGHFKNHYKTTVSFTYDNRQYLFAQSEKKRWFITELKPDGSGFGKDTSSGHFKNYYQTAVSFVHENKPYLYAQAANGRWFITELRPDGSGFGKDTGSGTFKNFYHTAICFVYRDANYIFAQNDKKRWFITELKPDGSGFGQDSGSGTFKNNYHTAVSFEFDGVPYMFAQNPSKRWFITKLDPKGSGFGKDTASGTFAHEYDSAIAYTSFGKPYIYAISREHNRSFITNLVPDGSGFGHDLKVRKYKNFYETLVPFYIDDEPYVFGHNQPKCRWFIKDLTVLDRIDFKFDVKDIEYESVNFEELDTEKDFVARSTFKNPTRATITQEFSKSVSKLCRYEWSVSNSFLVGLTAKFEAKIPLLGASEVTARAEYTHGSTKTWASEKNETYSTNTTIEVPPETSIEAAMCIDWDDNLCLKFDLLVDTIGKMNKSPLSKLQLAKALKFIDPSTKIIETSSAYEVTCLVKGNFTGSYGLKSEIIVQELEAYEAAY